MDGRITIPNIEEEMREILKKGWMCRDDIKHLVLLGEAMDVMHHVDREFTEEDARKWVEHMDPPARWTMEQTTAVMRQFGYSHRPCVFYAVMNMLFSDYGRTVIRFNVDKPEFWAALAHDFIDDPDAEDMKVGRYWRDIVRH
jgi:hypothetical protein